MSEERELIHRLEGPILVLGASGFVGANVFRALAAERRDVFGTSQREAAWRLAGLPAASVLVTDLLVESNLIALLDEVRPRTVLNCVAYGAYSFETDPQLIYRTNVAFTVTLLEELARRGVRAYVHAGSSSEYGVVSAAPDEASPLAPNSHYAASKAAAASVIHYMGKHRGLPCVNLRLYSIYGPYEDPSRLIPTVIAHGVKNQLPPFARADISRDFVHVDDVCHAFVRAAARVDSEHFGESFNIGTGRRTTLGEVAAAAQRLFSIEAEPEFTFPARDWDLSDWFAAPGKASEVLGWEAGVSFDEGLRRTADWFRGLDDAESYLRSSKKLELDHRHSVSAIIACYKDAEAIPIMHQRLTEVFGKLAVDYEIIFVNDGSPDDTERVVQELTRSDRRVLGISHSRNFGSQAAFRSGLEIAGKNAAVLLDGDLQDPPELIEPFVAKWKEGYDVVYGRRVKRDAPWFMQIAYKLFYRLFDRFSYLKIPHDAGDFSLLDRRVVRSILQLPERDLFLRGVRAFVGFRQVGVDYVRPRRPFGVSTNSLLKNVGWAKKGILSFSNTPLNMLSAFAVLLLGAVATLGGLQVLGRLLFPDAVPRGITTLILIIMSFGAVNLLAIAVLGEYIAKIFEEVKRRPHFLRRSIIRDGEVRDAGESAGDGS